MSVLQGTAIVWGVSTTDLTGYTAEAGEATVSGEDWSEESSNVELKDKSGITKTIYWYDAKKKLSLTCYPSGASADATNLPSMGEKVTVTAATDSNIAGDWICNGISKSRKVDGVVEFKIDLMQYEGITPT